ncbi:MAG: DUF4388 domain-containing protein, partial [Thermodesulfobacteriota bacterium]
LLDLIKQEESESPITEEEKELTEKIERLREKIEIKEVRGTRLLSIEVEDEDPRAAQKIANALAESYINYDSEIRLKSSKELLKWMSEQLYAAKKAVADAEKDFLAFKEKQKLFSAQGRQQISMDKLGDINASLVEVRTQILEKQAIIEELGKFLELNEDKNVTSIPRFMNNTLLEELYGELVKAQVEYERLSGIYKSKHPEIVQLIRKISGLNTKIKNEIAKALENAKAEMAVLAARDKALKETLDGYESEAIATNKDQLEFAILEREVETSKELYSTLLNKIKESDLVGEMPESVLRLMERASLPTAPVKPRVLLNLTLSLVLGLFLGIGLALFLEFIDQSLHNRGEIERFVELPVLAEIPLTDLDKDSARTNGKYPGPELNILTLPYNNPFSESYALLATGLKFWELNKRRGAFLVTSSAPSEGKSTIAYNLGVRLSDIGLKVLMLEGDLRLPASKKLPGLRGRPGLTNILVDLFETDVKKGRLGELTVGDVHKLIEVQERSGVLFYRTEKHKFRVFFHRGRMADIEWLTRPHDDRLGNLLLRGGVVSPEQLKLALEKQKSTAQRLGQVLLALGFLRAEELAGPLKLQMQENLKELFRTQRAAFYFKEDFPLDLAGADDMNSALVEAIGEITAQMRPPTPYLFSKIEKVLVKVPDTQMVILTSGKSVPNPGALLGGQRMAALMELCRRYFDVILIDSPPAGSMGDAAILAARCDGVLFVIRAGQTHIAEVRRAKDHLSSVPTPIVGTILNMLDMEKSPYYGSYYYKYYRYAYGKTEEE